MNFRKILQVTARYMSLISVNGKIKICSWHSLSSEGIPDGGLWDLSQQVGLGAGQTSLYFHLFLVYAWVFAPSVIIQQFLCNHEKAIM